MAKVERTLVILHDAEVQSLYTLGSRATLIAILVELQTSTSEAKLLHEDTLVADSDLKWDGTSLGIEARLGLGLGKLKNLGPGDVVSLDEAGVVGVPAAAIRRVEVGQRGIGRDSAVEDDGASLACSGENLRALAEGRGRDHGGQKSDECSGTHGERVTIYTNGKGMNEIQRNERILASSNLKTKCYRTNHVVTMQQRLNIHLEQNPFQSFRSGNSVGAPFQARLVILCTRQLNKTSHFGNQSRLFHP